MGRRALSQAIKFPKVTLIFLYIMSVSRRKPSIPYVLDKNTVPIIELPPTLHHQTTTTWVVLSVHLLAPSPNFDSIDVRHLPCSPRSDTGVCYQGSDCTGRESSARGLHCILTGRGCLEGPVSRQTQRRTQSQPPVRRESSPSIWTLTVPRAPLPECLALCTHCPSAGPRLRDS